jgi:uncharacterized protein with LGFP repeats
VRCWSFLRPPEWLRCMAGSWLATRSLGGPASALGLPMVNEHDAPGGRASDFEHGTATWSASTGAVTVTLS